MKQKMPLINESEDYLLKLMREQTDVSFTKRLQTLYLVKTGQAHTRQEVARLLGVSRNTVGRWLTTYQNGGPSGLLTKAKPMGKTPLLSIEMRASLKEQLQSPEGFKSYRAIQQFIQNEYEVTLAYQTVHKLVHYKWKAKLKVARKSHKKKR